MQRLKTFLITLFASAIFAIIILIYSCTISIKPMWSDAGLITPTPTATIKPDTDNEIYEIMTTPNGQGLIQGYALIEVTGLYEYPHNEKESIFCIENYETGAWLNIRHRDSWKYQPKGALNQSYDCTAEINWHHMKKMCDGIWRLQWGEVEDSQGLQSYIKIIPPTGEVDTSMLNFNGVPAWKRVRAGSADNRLPMASNADIKVLAFSGILGHPVSCQDKPLIIKQ